MRSRHVLHALRVHVKSIAPITVGIAVTHGVGADSGQGFEIEALVGCRHNDSVLGVYQSVAAPTPVTVRDDFIEEVILAEVGDTREHPGDAALPIANGDCHGHDRLIQRFPDDRFADFGHTRGQDFNNVVAVVVIDPHTPD